MIVYPIAGKEYIYAWAAKEFKQKAAKIFAGTAMTILKDESGWYEIEKLPEGTYGAYPLVADKWFIDPVDVEQHVVVPGDGGSSGGGVVVTLPGDAELGAAFRIVLSAIRAIFKG